MRSIVLKRMPLQDPFAMLTAQREVDAGPGASMARDGSGGGSSEAPLPGNQRTSRTRTLRALCASACCSTA